MHRDADVMMAAPDAAMNSEHKTLPPLPPLPDPVPPSSVQGQRLEDIYAVIRTIRREIDNPASHDTILEMLSEDHNTLKALATVLHQSGRLLRQDAERGGEYVPLPVPSCAAPPLLPGVSSWIAEGTSRTQGDEVVGSGNASLAW
jgi:hypothetical protein